MRAASHSARQSALAGPRGQAWGRSVAIGLAGLAGLAIVTVPGRAAGPFVPHTIATDIQFGYQVLVSDLNNDGRADIIALGARMPELLWFENPDWTRHVLTDQAQGMINMDAADTDGDGIPEIALAYGFSTNPANSTGNLAILRHAGDPRDPWTLREIDQVPSSHRIRFGYVDGSGTPVLFDAPILHAKASGFADPDRLPTPLFAYRPGAWTRQSVTTENQGVVHGLLAWDSDGDGQDEMLTAGRLGVHAHGFEADGTWSRTQLAVGDPQPYPDGGSSDLGAGSLDGEPFFAAIEPFHGNQVVVYRGGSGARWDRTVIDTELSNGHSLLVADLSGNGRAELVAAGTRGPKNLYLYRLADLVANRWERSVIDDAIAANSCSAGDINGDGRLDVACIDNTAPFSVKWYENTGQW